MGRLQVENTMKRFVFIIGVGCAELEDGPNDSAVVQDTQADSAIRFDTGELDSGTPLTQLAIGSVSTRFCTIDTNPTSITYEQPVTVTDKTGFVTGWYFFKSS